MLRDLCLVIITIGLVSVGRAEEERIGSVPRSVRSGVLQRLARKIEPDLVGRPERLRQYVDFFRSELGNDSRLIAFRVSAEPRDGKAQLRGYVEFPETRASLAKFLGILGFDVVDQLETLPATGLGEQIFGLVKTSHSLSYSGSRTPRSAENDCLIGEPLYLLREENGFLLVHSGEGYLGYVRAEDVMRVDAAGFARYLDGPRARMISDYNVGGGFVIPAGARLRWIRETNGNVACELPTGELLSVPSASCEIVDTPVAEIDKTIHSAEQLLGTEYFWGGRTKEGVDCSGLVQIGFASAGLHLPRDAYQQFYLGRLTATRWHTAGMRRGDTLYFLAEDGKIRHTAIYLGGDRYLHACPPVVRINSFNPKHDDYAPDRRASFAFAKRLVD